MRNFLFVAALIGAVALAPMAAAAGPEGAAPAAPSATASPTMPDFADLAFRAGTSYQPEAVPSESESRRTGHRRGSSSWPRPSESPSSDISATASEAAAPTTGAPATSRTPPETSSAPRMSAPSATPPSTANQNPSGEPRLPALPRRGGRRAEPNSPVLGSGAKAIEIGHHPFRGQKNGSVSHVPGNPLFLAEDQAPQDIGMLRCPTT